MQTLFAASGRERIISHDSKFEQRLYGQPLGPDDLLLHSRMILGGYETVWCTETLLTRLGVSHRIFIFGTFCYGFESTHSKILKYKIIFIFEFLKLHFLILYAR